MNKTILVIFLLLMPFGVYSDWKIHEYREDFKYPSLMICTNQATYQEDLEGINQIDGPGYLHWHYRHTSRGVYARTAWINPHTAEEKPLSLPEELYNSWIMELKGSTSLILTSRNNEQGETKFKIDLTRNSRYKFTETWLSNSGSYLSEGSCNFIN